jgi:hypothetical protein
LEEVSTPPTLGTRSSPKGLFQFVTHCVMNVRYYDLYENEQIFASKCKLVLPSEEELRKEIERERAQISNISDPET